jgi:hypothetical protein
MAIVICDSRFLGMIFQSPEVMLHVTSFGYCCGFLFIVSLVHNFVVVVETDVSLKNKKGALWGLSVQIKRFQEKLPPIRTNSNIIQRLVNMRNDVELVWLGRHHWSVQSFNPLMAHKGNPSYWFWLRPRNQLKMRRLHWLAQSLES